MGSNPTPRTHGIVHHKRLTIDERMRLLVQPGQASYPIRLFLYVSGAASAVGTVTIIAFFAVGQPWGTYNDFSYGIMALAMLPVLVNLRPVYKHSTSKIAGPGWVLGVIGVLGFSTVSFVETAKDVGLITLGPLEPLPGLGPFALGAVFFPLFDLWPLLLGAVLKRGGVNGAMKMGAIAATAIGYPLWAVWMARRHQI